MNLIDKIAVLCLMCRGDVWPLNACSSSWIHNWPLRLQTQDLVREEVRRKWKAKGSGLLPMDLQPETQTRWCVQRATSRSITLVPWLNTGSLTVMSGSMSVTSVRKPLRDKIICEYISVSDSMNCTNENTWKLFAGFLKFSFSTWKQAC